MWYISAVLLFIVIILLLPIFIIITSDAAGKPKVEVKLLFIPLNKKKKKAANKTAEKPDKPEKKPDFKENLIKNLSLLTDIFKKILKLSKKCTIKKAEFDMTYSAKDAAETAVNYGICCTTIYNMFGFLNSAMRFKEKGRKINLNCDFEQKKVTVQYHFVVSVRICSIISTVIGVLISFIKKRKVV